MSSSTSNAPTHQQVAVLCQKLYDADSDIRYMSLNDLLNVAQSPTASAFLTSDFSQCAKLVDGFLNTLNDPNGEVQNLTIKCLGPFVLRAHPDILSGLLNRVANQKFDNTVDSSISSMALRTIIVSLPRPTPGATRSKVVTDSYQSISSVLIPRLIGQAVVARNSRDPIPHGLLQDDLANGTDSQAIDILTEIAKCFGSMLQPAEVKALQELSLKLLESPKSGSVMKKKAMIAFAALAPFFSDVHLSNIITHIIEAMKQSHLTPNGRKNYISLLGSLARAIPTKFGAHLKIVVPFVLAPLSQTELDEQMGDSDAEERDTQADEVREIAMAALESFLVSCPNDMQRFTTDTLDAILLFLKYDANFAGSDADMPDDFGGDDDDEFADDDDFEQEDLADDDDDISWKVRRSAAKTLQAIISVKGKDLLESSETFTKISRALLDRFKEREESVRLEIVYTTTFMVRQCGQEDAETEGTSRDADIEPATLSQQLASRKRRRGISDASMSDHAIKRRLTGSNSPSTGSPAPPGAPANLAGVGPAIMQAGLSLTASSTAPTKLATMSLLKSYIVARHGGAKESLKEIFDLTSEHIQSAHGTAIQVHAGAGPGSLQVESLQLLSEVCKATSSNALGAHIAKAVPAVINATHNRSTQVACEALRTAEQLIKAMTPPRSASQSKQSPKLVGQLLDVMMEIAGAKSSDLDTRKQAIEAIGTTVGRTLSSDGSRLISDAQRQKSFELLQEGMKNETTRYASIRAVEGMGIQAPVGVELDKDWFTNACVELGNQLRKADRSLRGASLSALRMLIADRKGGANLSDARQLTTLLLPLLGSNDLHMIGPTLVIYASLISFSDASVMAPDLIKALCDLLCSSTATNVVDQLSVLADAAGVRGVGADLMTAMLRDVGVKGPPAVVGKVIGDLLVSAGDGKAGVKLEDFLKELNSPQDDKRKCLALSVIGEVGLRSGSAAQLKPELFTAYFNVKSHEVPIAAAIALGRAAAGTGNLKTYVPVILQAENKYLSLHAMREALQYSETQQDLAPFSKSMWDAAVAAANTEESRTIGAECLSQLSSLSPKASLQTLQAMLHDRSPSSRSTAIITFRDIFSSTDSRFNKYLRPLIVDVLTSMMRDGAPDNRKTALNALSTAARHKPELVLPSLGALISPILDQTFEDASLIREVNMGPFKHKVDDGLEARKSAYETLYSLLELSPTHVITLVSTIVPRIVAGIADDTGIRTLCQHMLVRLARQAPDETSRVLDEVAERFRAILNKVLKENTVRIDQERLEEAKRSVVKATLDIQRQLAEAGEDAAGVQVKLGEGGIGVKWIGYVEDVRKDWSAIVRELEKELRDRI